MKNLLKYIVSAFIILEVLSSFSPSLAMDEEDRNEKPSPPFFGKQGDYAISSIYDVNNENLSGLKSFTHLEELTLRGKIKSLPEWFSTFTNLRRLHLPDEFFAKPADILILQALTGLEELGLSLHRLPTRTTPIEFSAFKNLPRLDIYNDFFKSQEITLGNLTKIVELGISSNMLE